MERVPCPAANTPVCPIYQQEGECFEDRHHKYWPSDEYSSRTEKQFRQLEVNKVDICRWLHNTIHAVALPPEHPTVAVMRKAIEAERQQRL
jgi:hypothetical protein